jgi:predicted RNA binding protein YcfA (HicA-like mRNA interferase family)
MSEKTPRISAKELIRILKKLGFEEVRMRGSHVILIHSKKNLKTVVPLHQGNILPIGTLKGILADAQITNEILRDLL